MQRLIDGVQFWILTKNDRSVLFIIMSKTQCLFHWPHPLSQAWPRKRRRGMHKHPLSQFRMLCSCKMLNIHMGSWMSKPCLDTPVGAEFLPCCCASTARPMQCSVGTIGHCGCNEFRGSAKQGAQLDTKAASAQSAKKADTGTKGP